MFSSLLHETFGRLQYVVNAVTFKLRNVSVLWFLTSPNGSLLGEMILSMRNRSQSLHRIEVSMLKLYVQGVAFIQLLGSNSPPLIIVTTYVTPHRVGRGPEEFFCSHCSYSGTTRVLKSFGPSGGWKNTLGISQFLYAYIKLSLITICIIHFRSTCCGCFVDLEDLKDIFHFCPNCDRHIGTNMASVRTSQRASD